MGSKGCSLIRFWRNLTEKDNGESAKYDKQLFFYMYLQFFFYMYLKFFHGSG